MTPPAGQKENVFLVPRPGFLSSVLPGKMIFFLHRRSYSGMLSCLQEECNSCLIRCVGEGLKKKMTILNVNFNVFLFSLGKKKQTKAGAELC